MSSDFDDLLRGFGQPQQSQQPPTPAAAAAPEPVQPAVTPAPQPAPLLPSAAAPVPAERPLAEQRRGSAPGARRASSADAAAEPKRGIAGLIAGNRRLVLGLGIPLASILLVGAAFAGGYALGQPSADAPPPTAEQPDARPRPETLAAALPVRTCSIRDVTESSALGTFTGVVADAKTGTVLYDRESSRGVNSRSMQFLLAGAAALGALGTDARLETKVVAGSAPGSVVLVGGGDPTLRRGSSSVYAGSPSIRDLAQQAKASYLNGTVENDPGSGVPPLRTIIVDATLWSESDNWVESWASSARSNGSMARVVPLLVDGDRSSAGNRSASRGNDPVQRAAEAFVAGLELQPTQDEIDNYDGVPQVNIVDGVANTGATVLGVVQSQQIATLVQQMIRLSDNTLAEQLARVASVQSGRSGTSDSVGEIVTSGVQQLGIETMGTTFVDASGFSGKNRVPASVYASLMTRLSNLGDEDFALRVLFNMLDKGAETGTLAGKFKGETKKVLKGKVTGRAAAGSSSQLYALRVRAQDGTLLTVSLAASGKLNDKTGGQLENVVLAVYRCGANLAAYSPPLSTITG